MHKAVVELKEVATQVKILISLAAAVWNQVIYLDIQLLMNETYETKCGLNLPFIIFVQRRISNGLRHGDDAHLPKVRTMSFIVESITYHGKNCGCIYRRKKAIEQSSYLQKTNWVLEWWKMQL